MELEAGARVGQYQVERPLGRGGMAVVYLVRHQVLGSRHALKLLSTTRRSIQDRLLREGRAQATLRHPNIVKVTDVVQLGSAQGLVMEYIGGPTLEDLLARTTLSLAQAVYLMRGIAAGVATAHRAGLFHRDLKPANVLLDLTDGRVVPKVADFGLVKHQQAPAGRATRTGATMGTPAYMAPEQIRDASRADARADIFSLGALLYECVCGQRAYSGDDVIDIFSRIAAGSYRDPREHRPDLPAAVVETIEACLHAEPELRLQSCEALLARLEAIELPPEELQALVSATDSGPPLPSPLTLAVEAAWPESSNAEGTWSPLATDEAREPPTAGGPTLTSHNSQLADSAQASSSADEAPPPPPAQPLPTEDAAPAWPRRLGMAALVLLLFGGSVGLLALQGADPGDTGGSTEAPISTDGAPTARSVAAPGPEEPLAEPASAERPLPAEQPSAAPTPATAEAPDGTEEPAREEVWLEPATAPDPAQPAPSDSRARVRVVGDADRVSLVGPSGTFGPGLLPPGDYTVHAVYAGRGKVEAATVHLEAGQELTLRCSSMMTVCRPLTD